MEMRKEDQPPERIWLNDEALMEHFERVDEKYARKGRGEDEEVPDFDQNEITRGLR